MGCRNRPRLVVVAFLLCVLCLLSLVSLVSGPGLRPAGAAVHTHVTPDGLETAACTCRPAALEERNDPSRSPDGWMQDEPRASFRRDEVPLPLVPDWVGTRVRATGGLVWGDADADGDEDLFVGTYWANQWPPLADYYNFIYLNEGGMLEAEPSWISVDEKHTTDAEWAFIDQDGYPDLFVGNGGESLQPSQVFFGRDGLLPNSAGWANSGGTWTIGCDAIDFDGDGDVDVATANQGRSGDPYRPTYLYRNLGNGLETTPSWQSAQVGITNDAAWGDMDGDGRHDLAVSGWVGWQTGVFRNLGTTLETTFSWTTGHPERTDKGIGWARVDGDTLPDLAVGGNGGPNWLFRNEAGMLGAEPVWVSGESYHGCQDLQWIDIDRDGDMDLATAHFSTGHIRIHLNDGGALSTIADWQYDAASSATALAFGDVDGDRMPDLAIGVANGPIELFLNTGTPMSVEEPADLPPPGVLRIRAWPNPSSGAVAIALESGAPFSVSRCDLFDLAGRRVATLSAPAGAGPRRTHVLRWTGGAGRTTGPAGIYVARGEAADREGRVLRAEAKVVLLPR